MRSLIKLFLVAILGLATTNGVFAQRPFENLEPDSGQEDSGDDEPVRPIERAERPSRDVERPDDDDLGFDKPEQTTEVNEKYAGWQESAGYSTDDRVGETLRANWVMADRNGEFTGTVRGIDGAEVAGMTIYLMNKGRLVKSTAVQSDGSFVFSNVQRGAYSMVGWGDKALFAFGLNILSYNTKANDATPTSLTINAFQNATTINTDWIRYYAPNISYRVYGRYSTDEEEDSPAMHYGFEGLTRYQPDAVAATSIGGAPVMLDADGTLVGRVHQMNSLSGRPVEVRSTKVMLMKNDGVVGSATTDNFGVFGIPNVAPGSYGLVAVGVDGVGSVGIQVAGGGNLAMNSEGEFAQDSGSARPFDFTLVSSETVGWLNHYANEVAYNRAILAPRRPDTRVPWGTGGPGGANGQCSTCGGGLNGGCCNACKRQQCSSPYLTFEQWMSMGCASCNDDKEPVVRRVGSKLRDGLQKLDQRFEDAFYENGGDGITGGFSGGSNQQGFQQQGFQQQGFQQQVFPQQVIPQQGVQQFPVQGFSQGSVQPFQGSVPVQGAYPIQQQILNSGFSAQVPTSAKQR